MIGQTISHYRVTDRVGAGGMGVVYRAHDPRLNRDVAIKVLPEEFSQQPDRLHRFEREARAAGALNHPNILAIYDVGDHDGTPYIVSELLRGENLRQRIDGGELTVRKAIALAAHVADGLAAAHSRGIVHRDLKPENVFITRDGHVKILDFGLAKLIDRVPAGQETRHENTVDEKTASMLTDAGTVVGTVSYMSPEQLHGSGADHRSDIFSFGVMLYELLSGRRPFKGESKAQIVASILRDDPSHFSDPRHPVPPVVERVVRQCLEKRPEDRFESAHDLAIALRAMSESEISVPAVPQARQRRPVLRAALFGVAAAAVVAVALWKVVDWSIVPPLPEEIHVAVLPIEAVGGDPDHELFAAGLAQVIADGLTLLEEQTRGELWVVPPSDVDSLEQVWRRDDVTIAIAGKLRLAEDRVRFELSAMAAEDGTPLRTAVIDDRLNNLSSLQQDPILRIAEMLELEVIPETHDSVSSGTTNVTEAWSSYLRGRGHLLKAGEGVNLDAAVSALERATREDPGYRPARVALADAYLRRFLADRGPTWLENGIAEAERAVQQGGRVLEAYLVLGDLHSAAGSDDRAIDAYQMAASSSSRNGVAYLRLGRAYIGLNQMDDSIDALQKSINLRPGYWQGHNVLGFVFAFDGAYDAAANQFRRAIELAPRNVMAYNNLGALFYRLERREEALAEFERSLAVEPNADAFSNLGALHFEEARFGDAAAMFEQAVAILGGNFLLQGNLADAYHYGGEQDKAERAYRRAIELGEEEILAGENSSPNLLPALAGYYGMLGEPARGFELLETAIERDPREPQLIAKIGEAYEDLGDRERALEWIGEALDNGLEVLSIERRPSLSRLREDPRFQEVLIPDDEP